MIGRLWPAWILGAVAAVPLALPSSAPAAAEGFSDEAVDKAIKAAKAWIWSQYLPEQGHWKEPARPANPRQHSYHGGYTALACYGLLAAGESYQEPRMKRALGWLAGVKMNATYCLGVRAQVWTYLPRAQGRHLLAKDAKQLIDSICRPSAPPVSLRRNPRYGSYTYLSNGTIGRGGDHSNTQFGILGVWAAARHHLEVPSWYWKLVYRHFEFTQNADGGWSYSYITARGKPAAPSKGTMTAAGLDSMFVAFDNLNVGAFVKCGRNPV
ncbi:MAG: hypothetical protein ACYS5V_14635, partial [Planctomycetota bacterium]